MKERVLRWWWFLLAVAFWLVEVGSTQFNVLGRNYSLRLLDGVLLVAFPLALGWWLERVRDKIIFSFGILNIGLIFLTLVDSWRLFHFDLSGFLYWGRWVLYWIVGWYLVYHPPARSWLILLSWGLVFISVVQYLFFNSIGFYNFGLWDPHHYRLFGTLFDPNFYGLVLFFLFIVWDNLKSKTKVENVLTFILFILLFFTFSRTIYLLVFFYFLISLRRRKNTSWTVLGGALALLVVLGMAFTLHGEGVKIWRLSTLYGRMVEDKMAWSIFSQHPLLGIGFNNIGLYKMRFLLLDPSTHSLGWFSFLPLDILVTGGIIGASLWGLFLYCFWQDLRYGGRLLFLSFIFHALFHNSFFYPFTLIIFFLSLGIIEEKPS